MLDDVFGRDLDLGLSTPDGDAISTPASLVDLQAVTRPDVSPRSRDLALARGRANLAQAIILRLQTERGELAPLGYPTYGSRHHHLIGEPNTEAKRNLVKLCVLECLRQEPRLQEIVRVDVVPLGPERWLEVLLEVEAIVRGDPTPLSLVVPFSFAGPLE
jgi:phage baseplate assembly protein W